MSIVNTDKISYAIGLIKDSFWNYRFKFVLTVILGFISGLFGGIGIGALIPLFSIITSKKNSETDIVSKIIQKFFSIFHLPYNVFVLLAFIVLLFILKAIVTYFTYYTNQKIASDYEKETRSELFEATIKADWPFLLEQKMGYLESILAQDINTGSRILTSINLLIMVATSIVMYAIIAFNISATITAITLGIGLLLFFFLKPLFYRSRRLSFDASLVSKQVSHHVSEHTLGAKTVKTMAVENEVIENGNKYFEDLWRMRIKTDLYNRIPGTFLEPVSLLFISMIFLFYYYYGSSFSIASFVAIVYLIQKEFNFMQSIQNNLNSINQGLPQLKIVMDYKKTVSKHGEIDSGSKLFKFKEKLELKNITFAYDTNNKILSDLNLILNKGEMVGLIGPSGAGKTTLADIMLGLFPAGSGEILLDGKDMSAIDRKSWRKNIGYVSQDTFLLNDTIENNIRFYNNLLTKEDIIKVVKIANIYDFIENQPDKFSTLVGERGVRLSGGQRQRVILARVLAKNPEILILDEATSALDNESELLIHEAIEKLKGKMTILVIAHRLSTIMNSDKLFVLENGKITEQGKPAEMLKDKDSYFYKVYNIIREK